MSTNKKPVSATALAEQNPEDTHEQFEKYLNAGSGGKQRTKAEVQSNAQHQHPEGDTRKIVKAMINNEKNRQHDKK